MRVREARRGGWLSHYDVCGSRSMTLGSRTLTPYTGGERLQKGRAGMLGTGASSTRGGVVLKGSDKRGLGAAGVCGL